MKSSRILKSISLITCFSVMILIFATGKAFAADYYMATNGSDSKDGSIGSPWADLDTSWEKLSAGDTLHIRGGTYSGQVTSILTDGPTGTSGNPITIQAYTGETPIFDGQNTGSTFISLYGPDWTIIDGLVAKRYGGHGIWLGWTLGSGNKAENITIRNCTLRNIGSWRQMHPIYVSWGAKDITINNNLIVDGSGYGVHHYHDPPVDGLLVYNNIIVRCYGGAFVTTNADNVEFYNNTFYNNTNHNLKFYQALNVIMKNNIIYGNKALTGIGGVVSLTMDHNLYWPNAVDNNDDGANSIQGDPLFVDAANEDWYLQSGSPAIDAGETIGKVTADYDDNPRSQGSAYDIGAYEQASGPPDIEAPITPTNLNATPISMSQINLTWTASTDNVGVTGYKIYRDSVEMGTSTATTYSDTGLIENTAYSYTVTAYDAAGNESGQSASSQATTAGDTTPPTITSASATSDTKVTIVFSEPVEQTSAETVANYAIDQGVTVGAASLGADLKTVTLTTSTLSEGVTYTLTVNNVKDRASVPNTVASNTQKTFTFTSSLVGYWKLDEGSGTNVADVSGNGNNGILVNNPTWTTGKFGQALSFDGIDDYIEIPDSTSLDNITNQITLIAWINTTIGNRQTILERYLYGTGIEERSFEFDITSDGKVSFGLSGDGTSSVWLKSNQTISSDAWTQLAAVSDGATMKIYINGVQDTNTLSAPSTIHPGGDIHIGRWWTENTWFSPFQGTIDEIKIYNVALSATEIQNDFNNQLPQVDSTPPAPPFGLTLQ